ncbi:PTS system, mannose-specific IIB component [Candidatus Arthromitus sp. SFB-mouse-Japan]|uniref:PTS sugar transporter subunit IIB n=1 Tax=Candidatus Arthromitus sp. SFB-mouse TaxID=49118 RepID=UPI00021B7DC9|nr:PTS sugar transporter subunit IIB [Candidatus Arthromitus sp. SFB-mouse]EIA26414.1 PTS system, mannose-specific IIAB component [Candidatus Arthromitus sp. SFB-5]EIA29166.1 PTS system, mannose-specific IIAB component [Candidatus Arthromitus sp. SFB-co]EIA29530.1 PTS system, mannose-specific IIAB component [Candidatus Arthromitus sp. SFB-4]EIA30391.1 PTS system, mannose-specific IIAB component [Candidatus Arthromitus sp. SFB-mouse-SU]EGX29206.1 PTS system, mannose-specific IIAB component [Can
MVGIILASHGKFADGILQSGSMIFGDQDNVESVILLPNEGPDDIRLKMENAIGRMDNKDEILFLVDMWGGTPFNQANKLVTENGGKWAIVTGLNLPMLIEAYASRLSMYTAHDIAKHILSESRSGIKILPEELEQKIEKKQSSTTKVDDSLNTGKRISYVLARIDTRLLHGQVATSWTKSVNPTRIIVVSDNVSKDDLRKKMIEQAAPPGVKAHVVPISKMAQVDKDTRFGNTRAMLLFESPEDALRAVESGIDIKEINLGSIAHSIGKVVVNRAIAMGKDDVKAIEKLISLGIKFNVKKVPSDSGENIDNLLKKAKSELSNN